MTMMREKAVKDLAQYNAEMKELERVIAHECSLKEFMTTKCNERSGHDDDHEMEHGQCKAAYCNNCNDCSSVSDAISDDDNAGSIHSVFVQLSACAL